jgi:N-acetylgalactosamine kinase
MGGSEGMLSAFRQEFGGSGEPYVCRAPGRVNIIGEHTDYNGLPVLPMTIGEDIRIAFLPRKDGEIRMRNVNAAFPARAFTNQSSIPPSPPGAWENYCKAAVQGLNSCFRIRNFPGMDLLYASDLPVSSGLSSSSAMVVASALVYIRVLHETDAEGHMPQITGLELPPETAGTWPSSVLSISFRLKLAALLAEAEQYVGTKGGGMDQAIILLGGSRKACKIDFFPLRVEQVPLPEDYAFVVCNSLVKAEKTGDALHRYNAGPRLCKLIAAIVAKQVREEYGDEVEIIRLGDLWSGHLCLTDREGKDLLAKAFPKEACTLREAGRSLGVPPDEIRSRWLGDLKEPPEGFALKKRARHQFTEYQRVEAARDALLSGDMPCLGRLMNASHESCAKDYEVSCPELDALVKIARASGAIGARLTGAGFGGCTVNLVPADGVDGFCASLRQKYYCEYLERADADPGAAMFVARSSDAAGYA